MVRYETLMLAVPEITEDESKNLESSIEKIVAQHQGQLVSFERWGKYRLAYSVNDNEYGVYYLTRFEAPKTENLVADLDTLFKVRLNDTVMRYMSTRLDLRKPLTYNRPPSLEEAPAREAGFMGRDRDRDRDRDGYERRGKFNRYQDAAAVADEESSEDVEA